VRLSRNRSNRDCSDSSNSQISAAFGPPGVAPVTWRTLSACRAAMRGCLIFFHVRACLTYQPRESTYRTTVLAAATFSCSS
jgi:hypothetical protein